MDRGKSLCLYHYVRHVSLLLHVQYYQRCKPMVLKIWWKVKLFSDYHVIITNWLKRVRKFTLLRHFFFWIFRWCSFGKFYMVIFNYFTARPERRKSEREVLKYFRLTTMLAIYEIKMLLVRIKKYWYQCRPSLLCRSVYRGCYIYNSLIHMIYVFICIVYLHVIEICLKLWFLCLIFGIWKALQM